MFCFIKANFLLTGKILLPEHFSDYEQLSREAKLVGMTEFVEALQEQCGETFFTEFIKTTGLLLEKKQNRYCLLSFIVFLDLI